MRHILLTLSGVASIGLVVATAGSPSMTAQGAQLFADAPARMTSPAPEGSAEPRLTVDATGRVLLSWLAPKVGGGHSFQFSELTQNQWAAPKTIVEGTRFFANWADFPSLFVTRGGVMAAHWLERRGQGRTSYDVKLRTSRDNGRTWTETVTPHRDGTETEHGFVTFFEAPGKGPNAGLGLVWLDGRGMAGHGDHGGDQQVDPPTEADQDVDHEERGEYPDDHGEGALLSPSHRVRAQPAADAVRPDQRQDGDQQAEGPRHRRARS